MNLQPTLYFVLISLKKKAHEHFILFYFAKVKFVLYVSKCSQLSDDERRAGLAGTKTLSGCSIAKHFYCTTTTQCFQNKSVFLFLFLLLLLYMFFDVTLI